MAEPIKYRSAFLKSKYHAILAISTIGLGFIFGQIFPLIMGIVVYALGWLYIPDMPFFKKAIDDHNNWMVKEEQQAKLEQFMYRRDKLLSGLSPDLKSKYRELVGYCEDIERETATTSFLAGPSVPDIRVKKLDELMWTYLRLLCMDQSLSTFIHSEKQEYVEQQIKSLEDEISGFEKVKDQENKALSRLIQSKTSMLETLKRRLARIKDSRTNSELVKAEQERLVEQIRLLRADSFAMQNSDLLSQRIDASMEQLAETNKWLAELDSFKDVMDNGLPNYDARVGYGVEKVQVETDYSSTSSNFNKKFKKISIKKAYE